MSSAWGWNGTLVFWSVVSLVAAFLWLTVDVDAGQRDARTGRAGLPALDPSVRS
jgi:hypothetical protein